RAIYRLERNLEAEPGVGKAVSYVDFVRKMHLAMNADRSDAGELPGTRALTAQYLFLYTLSGGADDFDTLLDPTHRTAKVRLLVAMPLGLTVAVNFGVMGLLGIPLDTITSAISAMAVGIGADYAIYFLFRVREELAHGGKLEDALGRALMTSGKAVFFVSSAIAFGYATLCLSGFAFHVQLGSLVALAMLVSSGNALVPLPAAL